MTRRACCTLCGVTSPLATSTMQPALGLDTVRLFFGALAPDVRARVLQGARIPLLAGDLVLHVIVTQRHVIPAPGPDLLAASP